MPQLLFGLCKPVLGVLSSCSHPFLFVTQEIEFSPDLQRNLTVPGSPVPNASDVAMSPGTRAKRQRTPSVLLKTQPGETQIVATPGSKSKQYTFCHRLVRDFTKNKDAVSFAQPVMELWRPEAIPNYHTIIKFPMDLRTVLRKMESGLYVSLSSFDSCIGLCSRNVK
eukprot:Plantae.Rhodophyta-Purpureofilum_apyrenoidigerum.ctg23097.p1 GENE.Plantae.Rhodophyta-Purpureofilum_apyrenoidigerum.ctg23097~~Plantae.Rhodophyta-Purpureofilum_apyrenoidigerum.ctg23097.p1  ORF type:complete len:167 (+),score=7.24 Plantae.Rhodophyta-Purpureofilum_apyrenoidigerum.ctg23097:865-1365(+)